MTGAATIFALFPIDQFRTIAWYNVGFGALFIVLLIAMYHGESSFSCTSKITQRLSYKKIKDICPYKCKLSISVIVSEISISFLNIESDLYIMVHADRVYGLIILTTALYTSSPFSFCVEVLSAANLLHMKLFIIRYSVTTLD